LLLLSLISVLIASIIFGWKSLPGKSGFVLGYASSITPLQVVERTNAERAKSGLAPLTFNTALAEAATAKGKHMLANQYWAHNAPDGTQPWSFIKNAGYSYNIAGENLARDFDDTPNMISAWMASATHRANIMNPRYSDIGIAVIDGSLDGYETTLVVQMFGSPKSVEPAISQEAVREVSISEVAEARVATTEADLAQGEVQLDGDELAAASESSVPAIATLSRAPVSPESEVLASFLVPQGEVVVPPLFTPLQLMKAVFLSITMILILTLMYDAFIIGNRYSLRLVGNNLAHIAFWFAVAFLIIFFKGGIIG
jgi:hypothetical protein